MNQINILSQETINLIAAGEVIERPMSVVKELLENAIDAKANAVTVEIKDGGISYIRITDNGLGIPKSEIRKAFLRHATSKINDGSDLVHINSLGFRGEALSSIAAVSQVELITKTAEDMIGCCYRIEGGEEKEFSDIGAPNGTSFIVRNLFYHTPARKKFLKTPQTEAGYISELVERVALSHPEVAIKLIVNGQVKIATTSSADLKDHIYAVYGREITANLIRVHNEADSIIVDGFIGKPAIARGNRSFENYFINGRYSKNKIITKAIEDGYKTFLMQHRFPFSALNITIRADELDVNVHPAKAEVRLHQESLVYRTVYYAVFNALSGREYIPEVTLVSDEQTSQPIKMATAADNTAPEPFETKRSQNDTQNRLTNTHHNETSDTQKQSIRYTEHPNQTIGAGKEIEESLQALKDLAAKKEQNNWKQPSVPSFHDTSVGYSYTKSQSTNGTASSYNENAKETNSPIKSMPMTPNSHTNDPATIGNQTNPKSSNLFDELKENTYVYHQESLVDKKVISMENRSKYRLVGQVFDTFWIFEYEDSMYMMDQHAAHEKVLFEKNMKMFRSHESIPSQLVSPPVIFSMTDKEVAIFEKMGKNRLEEMGFEIEEFGGNEYAIRAIPADIPNISAADVFLDIVDSFESDVAKIGDSDTFYDRVATMSCKAAVKSHDHLSTEEANALLDELMTLDNPYMCPHGRPTIITFKHSELDKKFKRIID